MSVFRDDTARKRVRSCSFISGLSYERYGSSKARIYKLHFARLVLFWRVHPRKVSSAFAGRDETRGRGRVRNFRRDARGVYMIIRDGQAVTKGKRPMKGRREEH